MSYSRNSGRNYNHRGDGGGGGGGGYGGKRDSYQSRSWYRNSDPRNEGLGDDGKSEAVDIPYKKIGKIIGQGGSNIKRIQTEYQVRLKLNKDTGVLNIFPEENGNVEGAMSEINRQLADETENQRYGDRQSSSNSNYGRTSSWSNEVAEQEAQSKREREPDDGPVTIDWDSLNKKAEEEQRKRWAKCGSIRKDFYNEDPEVAALSPEEVERIRMSNNNTVVARGFDATDEEAKKGIPNPIWKFEQCFRDYPDLMEQIQKQGFAKPTPIQSQAWPVLLKGEDMIGIAQTGTGKTLAFLLPAMIHTEYQETPRRERVGPTVLVLAPTRELALQIKKEVDKYEFRGMAAVCVYGGGDREQQKRDCEKGTDIIICTPGRLNDFIDAKIINVSSISFLILDEADRMLDMGFEPQIRKVLLDIRPDRQTVMTSATWPPGVRRLAKSYMQNPITVSVGSLDLAATHSVTQLIYIMDESEKYGYAKHFVKNMKKDEKVIIFCSKKVRADDLSSEFTLENICCQSIHGNRDQRDREQAISDISSGYVQILIATDVASRGLDIEDVTHVINFDLPHNIEEYVHRVGRTGRAGRSGTSISYVTREDWGVAGDLINILEEANQEVPQELREMAERFQAMKDRRRNELDKAGFGGRRGGGGGGGGGRYGGGGGSGRYRN